MAKFGRDKRLNIAADYAHVFKQGKYLAGGGVTVLSVANSLGTPRLGLAVAKKHLKKATQRNRLKRIIRTSFAAYQAQLGGVDIVVLSRADVTKRESKQIWQALAEHWKKVGVQSDVSSSG